MLAVKQLRVHFSLEIVGILRVYIQPQLHKQLFAKEFSKKGEAE